MWYSKTGSLPRRLEKSCTYNSTRVVISAMTQGVSVLSFERMAPSWDVGALR